MEHKSSNFRHFNCLSLSVVLHSMIIIGLGLAPAMLLNKGDGTGGKAIDITVVGDQSAPVAAAPAPEPVAVQPEPMPTPVVAETKPAPEKPVAVVKETPVKKKPAKKAIETVKETVEPQPAVEVAETMNEEQPLPEKEEIPEETVVATQPVEEIKEVTTEEPTQEEAPQPKPVAVAEAPAQQPEEKPASPVAETSVEQSAEAPAPQAGEGMGGGQNGNSTIASAGNPQNFLTLKQAPGNKPPQYTREMRLNRLEGRGQLMYYVTRDGQVSQLKLTQSTGSPELDRAAIEAFSKYRFIPGQEGYTVHNFEFTLKGPAETDAGRLRTTLSR